MQAGSRLCKGKPVKVSWISFRGAVPRARGLPHPQGRQEEGWLTNSVFGRSNHHLRRGGEGTSLEEVLPCSREIQVAGIILMEV